MLLQSAVRDGQASGNPTIERTAALVAALALATCWAAFSISGLTSIFAGAFCAVIGLGIAFELGKLSAAAWLGQRQGAASLRLALSGLVAVLMLLNSIGIYGYLSRAHIERALAGDLAVSARAADLEARVGVQQAIADVDRRIAQINRQALILVYACVIWAALLLVFMIGVDLLLR